MVAAVVMSGYASYMDVAAMDLDQLFDCYELALVKAENETRAYRHSKRDAERAAKGGR